MKNLIVVFLLSVLVSGAFAQSGWLVQNTGVQNDLNNIYFINKKTGWAAGNNVVLKTLNSGVFWTQVPTVVNTNFRSVFFVDSLSGWLCGYNGVILKTSDGGINWENQTFNLLLNFTSIHFVNSLTGWAAGNGGAIYKTTNGGLNWLNTNPGFSSTNFTKIFFLNDLTGFCTGFFNTSKLIKSTNGGANWFDISPSLGFGASFSFINELTGWTSGALGTSYTSNGGQNWTYTEFFNNQVNSIQFINSQTGYSCGTPSTIFKTTNAGSNWFTAYSGPFTVPNSIFAIDTNSVWSCGTGGKIYYGSSFPFVNYLPLQVGNSWTYETSYDLPPTKYKTKVTIIADTIINGIKYSKTSGVLPGFTGNLVRIDTLTGNILCYSQSPSCVRYSQQLLIDSIAGKLNDTFLRCHNPSLGKITDTSEYILPWQTVKSKKIYYSSVVDESHTYGWNFGLVEMQTIEGAPVTTRLTGCVINGTLYGDTASVSPYKEYIPLQIGNSWTYRRYNVWPPLDDTITITITSDTIIGGIKYYKLSGGLPSIFNMSFFTLDTITGNFMGYDSKSDCSRYPNRVLVDSLAARKGDSIKSCPTVPFNGICRDTQSVNKFGYKVKTKSFSNTYPLSAYPGRTYSEKFGIISAYTSEVDIITYNLIRCTINGITYSDSLYNISGTIKFGDNSQPVTEGYVKAIKLNTTNGDIITYDSVQIQADGVYELHSLPSDLYYIVAYPNSEKQADFVPTYYPMNINWQMAVRVNSANSPANVNISVFRKTGVNGSYHIAGEVNAQTNTLTGIDNAIIYIKQGNYFRDFFITANSGEYTVNNLPSGSYEVIADRMGYVSAHQNVMINSSNIDNVNFSLLRVGIENITTIIPKAYNLYQNYPNPFNPVTKIKFDLPQSGFVVLKIYNVLGKEVGVLLNEVKQAGTYIADFNAINLSSGVYFYKLTIGEFTETRRMVLIK